MIICEVLQSGTIYVFKSKFRLEEGTMVLCDTRYGEVPGTVKKCFEVSDTESDLYKRYLALMRATEPLKEVIGAYIPFDMVGRFVKICKEKNNG